MDVLDEYLFSFNTSLGEGLLNASMKEMSQSILETHATSSAESFYAAITTNIALGCVLLLLFTLIRHQFRWLYEPRISSPATVWALKEKFCDSSCLLAPAPKIKKKCWLLSSFFLSPETVLATAGLDAYMLVKVYQFGRDLLIMLSVVGSVVLIPEYSRGALKLGSLEGISMSNIKPGEHLYIVILMCYAFSGYTLYLLRAMYRDFISHRLQYLTNSQKQGLELSLMIQNIPDGGAYFAHRTLKSLFPELTDFVQYMDTHNIEKLLEKRQEILLSYQKAKDERAKQVARNRLQGVNQEIQHTKHKILPLPVAFASFSSARALSAAMHTRLTCSDPFSYTLSRAFHPGDLYLRNLRLTTNQRFFRSLCVSVTVWASVFCWIVPVSLIGSFARVEFLVALFPPLAPLVARHPVSANFLEGILPGLVLSVSLTFMPILFWWLSIVAGHESQSRLQVSVLKYHFVFVLFNCFLVLTISGSIVGSVKALLSSPMSAVTILGQALPGVSMFFMSFVLFQALTYFPMQLLAVGPLFQGLFMRWWNSNKDDAFLRSLAVECDYGSEYPTLLLVFVVGFTYACISPIVAPACLLYFLLGGVVKRYQTVYMFVNKFETGGNFWPYVYDRIITCMIVGQLTWIGIVALKQSTTCLVLLVPLPCITIFVARRLKQAYKGMADFLPAEHYIQDDDEPVLIDDDEKSLTTSWECPHGHKLADSESQEPPFGLYRQEVLSVLASEPSEDLYTERTPLLRERTRSRGSLNLNLNKERTQSFGSLPN